MQWKVSIKECMSFKKNGISRKDTSMTRILPMAEPIIKCYPYHAHVCSIVGAQSEYHIPWIYNYYVQLSVINNLERVFVDYVTPYIYTALPCVKMNKLERNIALDLTNGIINFIKYYIDREFYIYAVFDVSQIAAYRCGQFFPHDPLIYGYDDEKEEVYFADNYMYGRYSLGTASYSEIIQATKVLSEREEMIDIDWAPEFRCVKYTDKCSLFEFNIQMYINLLNDYIEQKDSVKRWRVPGIISRAPLERIYGIGIYSFMQDYIGVARNSGANLDRRAFYVLKEHKLILEKSLTYVMGDQWKSKYSLEWKMVEKDMQMATIMCNLCLKYNLTHDEKILDKIRNYLISLEENDKIMFPCLIRMVEKKRILYK